MATWWYFDQVTEPGGWLQLEGGGRRQHAPVGRPTGSALGCEVAMGALGAAGRDGLPYLLLRHIVMTVGRCSEVAADQQLRTYVRHRVAISDSDHRRDEARVRSGTRQPKIPYRDQTWVDRQFRPIRESAAEAS